MCTFFSITGMYVSHITNEQNDIVIFIVDAM